jgi:hypothetical protein
MDFDSFHDLRHTHATLLLKGCVHPKIVSERLGTPILALPLILIAMSCGGYKREWWLNGGKEFCPGQDGPLAQLVEQLTLNQQVQGSSPWRLTLDAELPTNYYSNDFPGFYYPSSSFLWHSATDKLVR